MKKLLTITLLVVLLIGCTKESLLISNARKIKKPPTVTLPASYLLTTSIPTNQLAGECVAFAISNAMSTEVFYKTGVLNNFSVPFIYNLTKFGDCNSGTSFQPCLDRIRDTGICLNATMPYTGDCYQLPNSLQYLEAAKYKLIGYDKFMDTSIFKIKTLISQNHPVIFNSVIDNSFINAGAGFIWKVYSGSGAIPHAMVIVGYDNAKNAFKVMNSFGTNWGDGGFSWIDYNFFPVYTGYYVYSIIL